MRRFFFILVIAGYAGVIAADPHSGGGDPSPRPPAALPQTDVSAISPIRPLSPFNSPFTQSKLGGPSPIRDPWAKNSDNPNTEKEPDPGPLPIVPNFDLPQNVGNNGRGKGGGGGGGGGGKSPGSKESPQPPGGGSGGYSPSGKEPQLSQTPQIPGASQLAVPQSPPDENFGALIGGIISSYGAIVSQSAADKKAIVDGISADRARMMEEENSSMAFNPPPKSNLTTTRVNANRILRR